jgi:hypothetical protein
MTAHGRIDYVFDNLMRDSKDAFAKGYYAVAYHALAGAMHCAESLADLARLRLVADQAAWQQQWITTHDADDTISVASAARRGSRDVYGSLLLQAKALRERLTAARLSKLRAAVSVAP